MKFKKPKFWDYKKPNIASYLLLPISVLVMMAKFIKNVTIKKKKFQLFTDGDSAWVRKNKVEKALVKAMRSGVNMVVRGVSSRGTKTKDTYSLAGITSALKAIGKACRRN